MNHETTNTNAEILDSGAYEIIRKRLLTQKEDLSYKLQQLNQARKEVFDSKAFVLKANQRITTENNCVARGLTSIGNLTILGYNVHLGLRNDIKLDDVFSIYLFENEHFEPQNLDLIQNPDFVRDFENLYKYYKNSFFSRFSKTENYLFMIFQTSQNVNDIKAFKWLIKDGKLIYQDDRSVQEVKDPNQFDFVWTKTNLEDRRLGKHPHISILDKVFIEAIHGDITFKIEDNTDTGKGIYSEKVTNIDQQLDDAEYFYADLGNLIAIKIKPYQEDFRAFVFNVRTKQVTNISALNQAAILLPDNQGIIFSNGYYLQNGTYKVFDTELDDVTFYKRIASPNGEDFLYIFNQKQTNTYILFSYNIIQQAVEIPIYCNGVTLFKNGNMVYFKTDEAATRHHQVQIWETPYVHQLKENPEQKNNPIYKVGNKQIVQAMAEVQEVIQLINKEDSYEGLYEDILKKSNAILDSYFWINQSELGQLGQPLLQVKEIANTAIDEFVKVQALRKNALDVLQNNQQKVTNLQATINASVNTTLDQLVQLLSQTRKQQGELIDLKNVKYIDVEALEVLNQEVQKYNQTLSEKIIAFLLQDDALQTYENKVANQQQMVEAIVKAIDAKAVEQENTNISNQLELLIDILNSLKIDDPTQTTKIVEKIAVIFSSLNQIRAQLTRKLANIRSKEAVSEFHAQLTLLEQSVVNYLELSTTVEKSDEYYTKIIVQLEELESKFSDIDDFALKISDKRDEVIKAFHSKREQIVEQLNKRSTSVEQIGLRVLKNIENKAKTFTTREDIFSFYASDLMVDKIRQLTEELKNLQDVSKAENLENLLKKSQEDALRILRDKTDLYSGGDSIITLGQHKFTVNKQALSLTLVRKDQQFFYHLTGTSFYQKINENEFESFKSLWDQSLVSENNQVYRAEYLAYQTFLAFLNDKELDAKSYITKTLEQQFSAGFVKGVHDFDANAIFDALHHVHNKLNLLTYPVLERALARLFWNASSAQVTNKLQAHITSTAKILATFPNSKRVENVIIEIETEYLNWASNQGLPTVNSKVLANYIFKTLAQNKKFVFSDQANHVKEVFVRTLTNKQVYKELQVDLADAYFLEVDKFHIALNWVISFLDETKEATEIAYEVAVDVLFNDETEILFGKPEIEVSQLKGHHAVLNNGDYAINYHDFISKMTEFYNVTQPLFLAFQNRKEELIKKYQTQLKINEFEAKPLTSFVRNKLINQVYFNLIGNNLAKQLGAAGDAKRTARMGMLLLISPPGYGKTTLMEYLAQTMGLHFVKVNGPTIGHNITSIDPIEAKTSGEREELKKINLAFEMADNVMLYLDDIQHLSSEFLQKFISLADGQRKIDGIFEGESKTYDLRGKRFCIVMAGNPYTETGAKFQIPDMLANRADVYNLGDVIGDTEHLFNLSLIENAANDNSHLEKIASKSFTDFYALINYVENNLEQLPNLEANYLPIEIENFVAVLRHVIKVRNLVVQVNKNYILSAAMQNQYRTEPPFKLQGSYRNMSKLVASVVPMMNDQEIDQLLISHYEGESQTLTADTESNLLKLKEIGNYLTPTEQQRWEQIKAIFAKNNKHGGLDQNDKMFAQLLEFNDNLQGIINAIKNKN